MEIRMKLGILALAATALLWGQAPATGELSGKVTDAQGQGIPNVVIVLVETVSGNSQRIMAKPDGSFTSMNVPPGSYRVEVEAGGGRHRSQQNVEIVSGQSAQMNILFEPEGVTSQTGQQQGVVEIRAAAPLVQEDAEVSRQYDTGAVRMLPVQDRQVQQLIGLMPGVTPPTHTQDLLEDPQKRRQFHVNGQVPEANQMFDNGTYATEALTGNVSRVVPNEAIRGLTVRTGNYDSQFGPAAGSWSNVSTRPGTNEIHGSLFAFHTNSFFASRNPLNPDGNSAPRFNQNQFGGTMGGPIAPNKMFFFGSYEGNLRRGYQTQFATVPTAALRSGNFSAFGNGVTLYDPATGNASTGVGRAPFAGGMIPSSRTSPFSQALLDEVPLPNREGLANNLYGNVLARQDTHRADGQLDHRFNDRATGFFRYGFTHGDVDQGSLLGNLGNIGNGQLRNHSGVASVAFNATDTMLGELRLGYQRFGYGIRPFLRSGNGFNGSNGDFEDTLSGFGFTNGLPQITIDGFTPIGRNFAARTTNDTWDPSTNWILHTGIHRLKFGAQLQHLRATGFQASAFSPAGSFAFGPGATYSPAGSATGFNPAAYSFASFLTGNPSQAGVSQFAETPTWRRSQVSGYLQDTLNLWQRVYLELGVRYDLYTPYRTRFASGSFAYDPVTNSMQSGVEPNRDYNNIAPRVGIAIRPTERFVIRGGYGLYYYPTPIGQTALNQLQMGTQLGMAGTFGAVPFQVPRGTGNGMAANLPLAVGSTDVRTPYVQTMSAMVQADMGAGFLFDVGYMGTRGRQLAYQRALAAMPGTGMTGFPGSTLGRSAQTSELANGANSNYNALQANLTKRMSSGLAMSASYTWSRTMDTGSSLLNPFDRNANYAPSDFDRTHMLAISHMWRLPFWENRGQGMFTQILGGWDLNGVLQWASGTPYTVTTSPLFCNCPGVSAVPANYVGQSSLASETSFNTGLFETPSSGFGSLGRNAIRGPEMFNYNLSLLRNFAIREDVKMELRGEAYNLTNTTNLTNPVSALGQPGYGTSTQLFNGMGGRLFQVAARFLW